MLWMINWSKIFLDPLVLILFIEMEKRMKIRRNQRASSRGSAFIGFFGVKVLLGLARTIQGGKKPATTTTTKKRRMMTVLESDDR